MAGRLFVVGTPIGNLSDMSERGLETLRSVDFIAAEDTRVTVKLLNRFDIKKPLLSYYEHNKKGHGRIIVNKILSGEDCAIVTDAGMPAISDPGEDLVRECRKEGIEVVSVPGPSAVITALAVSGMPSGRFCFEGFLSVNKASRAKHLEQLKNETRTMIFYEAPHKLLSTLKDMLAVFGDREIALCRELTKLHEQIENTALSAAVKYYSENAPKGEFVIVLSGREETDERQEYTLSDALKMARDYMSDGMSASSAAKTAAADTGLKKRDIYSALTEEKDGP